MNPRARIIILSFIGLSVAGAATWSAYYLFTHQNRTLQINPTTAPTSSIAAVPQAPEISFQFYKSKTKNVFIIRWKYLPNGTTRLDVYRAKTGTQNWSLWKSVFVPTGQEQSGIAEITLSLKEDPAGYSYYVEAVRGTGGDPTGGEVVWTSPQDLPITQTDTLPPVPPPTSGNSEPPPPPPQENQSPTSTANSAQGTTPPPPPSPAPSPSFPPGTIIYYKPESGISGTGLPETANFWAGIVNQAVEIGWQNLPDGSDKLIVYRSQTADGPWNQVLVQQDPVYNGPYSIRVADETISQSYYYKMDVLSASGSVIISYGPILVSP